MLSNLLLACTLYAAEYQPHVEELTIALPGRPPAIVEVLLPPEAQVLDTYQKVSDGYSTATVLVYVPFTYARVPRKLYVTGLNQVVVPLTLQLRYIGRLERPAYGVPLVVFEITGGAN